MRLLKVLATAAKPPASSC